jgi:hypothetical protein
MGCTYLEPLSQLHANIRRPQRIALNQLPGPPQSNFNPNSTAFFGSTASSC